MGVGNAGNAAAVRLVIGGVVMKPGMRGSVARWVASGLLLLPSLSAFAAETPLDKVLACMRANIPQTVQIKEVELTATDRSGGNRVMRGRLYGTREDDRLRASIKIDAPADLAGAAYLLREREAGDEMYVYVPALNKVRRVTGAGVDGALWGTDLSYGDVKQLNNAFTAGNTQLAGTGMLEGRPVYLLAAKPSPAQPSRFGLVRTWIDQKSCVALKAEFLEGQTVRKRLLVNPKDLKQSGPHWYAAVAQMSDLQESTRTVLKVLGVSAGVDLSGRHFNPATFYLGG